MSFSSTQSGLPPNVQKLNIWRGHGDYFGVKYEPWEGWVVRTSVLLKHGLVVVVQGPGVVRAHFKFYRH